MSITDDIFREAAADAVAGMVDEIVAKLANVDRWPATMNTTEAAEYLGMSREWFSRRLAPWIERVEFPDTQHPRYTRAALDAFVKSCTRPAGPVS